MILRRTTLAVLLAGILLPSFPVALAAPAAQDQVPVTPIGDLANVDFSADVRVFAVMAALNAAGFDYETPGHEMSPVRKMVREQLAKNASEKTLSRLRSFYVERRGGLEPTRQAAAYISLALLINGPPNFGLIVPKKDVPDDVVGVLGFEDLVRDLNAEVNLVGLWNACQASYNAELAEYRPVFVEVIRESLAYFRIPPRITLDRQIVVIPDMLGPNGLVNARNLEKSYNIVLSPSASPTENRIQLEHEYLHFLLDPLIAKFGAPLQKYEEELLNLAQNQPYVRAEYQNRYMGVVAESLIESLILRLNPPKPPADPDREMVALVRRGLVFAPYFTRAFIKYESDQTLTLSAQMENMLAGVDAKTVRADESRIAEMEKKYLQEDAAKQTAEREDRQRRLRVAATRAALQEAQDLMRQKQYEGARARLEQLTAEDPQNAQVCFYLGQVSFQLKDYQGAAAWYKRAEEAPGASAVIQAWSRLRLGVLCAASGQFDEARAYFSQVVEMEGNLDGAREEAQTKLADLPPAEK